MVILKLPVQGNDALWPPTGIRGSVQKTHGCSPGPGVWGSGAWQRFTEQSLLNSVTQRQTHLASSYIPTWPQMPGREECHLAAATITFLHYLCLPQAVACLSSLDPTLTETLPGEGGPHAHLASGHALPSGS